MDTVDYVNKARAEDPEGTYCGECGLPNDHADDVGWFYVEHKYLCLGCWTAGGHTTCER